MESRVTDLGYGRYGHSHSSKSHKKLSATSGHFRVLISKKRKTPDMSMPRMGANNCSDENISVTEKSEVTSVLTSASKGDTPLASKVRDGKDQNMDISTVRQCAMILKKLMTHQAGWVFNQPVDPVKLNIPDYFSLISKPMDLGTIKHKLERKLYSSALQFAADVRLTFSNAMRYNPPVTTTSACINDTCVSMEFSSRCQYDVSQASGVGSERSLARESNGHDSIPSNLDFKNSSAGAAIIEEKAQTMRHLAPSPVATRIEDSFSLEQLSPSKALRAAMLKSRFADTIIKAQQKTLLNHGNKVDRVKMQREKEKLEKQQQEEKVRIEAQVRAAEAAARKRAHDELKMQREKEREAARLALRKMERTVIINDNYQTLKDLEALAFSLSGHQLDQLDRFQNPLEKLGLFMKHEELDEPDDLADIEEGEVGSL